MPFTSASGVVLRVGWLPNVSSRIGPGRDGDAGRRLRDEQEPQVDPVASVLWGVGLQWGFGVLLLTVPQGRAALAWASRGIQAVLGQSYAGSQFVFGKLGMAGGGDSGLGVMFAFQILPMIVFVASLFAILYYLGLMQFVVRGLARAMVKTMGISGAESLVVAANLFMGQTEAPLTVRPFLARLTESELFTVMVAGMASLSAAILGACVSTGRCPSIGLTAGA